MFRPTGDLFDIIGVGNLVDDPKGWVKVIRQGFDQDVESWSAEKRYAWKALSDPQYFELYRNTRSTEVLFRAGFFDDGLNQLVRFMKVSHVARFPATPTHKVAQAIRRLEAENDQRERVVLVTTGGMSPVHKGHLAMMEAAREIAQERGYAVVGGYLTPGHDSYVGQKYNGSAAIHAEHRIRMVELATNESDWLECNPWPARYLPSEINFTDVIHHLDKTINYVNPRDKRIKVLYVHGSDNPDFGLAVESIMIERNEISSSAVRSGNLEFLDPVVREYYVGIGQPNPDTRPYLIRNDALESVQFLKQRIGEKVDLRITQFCSSIRLAIGQLFKNHGETHKIHLLDIAEQVKKAKESIGDRHTISLDTHFVGDFNIEMTRFFDSASSQISPLMRASRPGSLPLQYQSLVVAPGEYVLVEDDVVTGSTIATARSILRENVEITDLVLLSDFGPHVGVDFYDIVDFRDFILGAKEGGLGTISRTGEPRLRSIYALPFVNLASRAKIPVEAQLDASRIIWQANARLFKGTGLTVEMMPSPFRDWAHHYGWTVETVEEICQYYTDALLESACS